MVPFSVTLSDLFKVVLFFDVEWCDSVAWFVSNS